MKKMHSLLNEINAITFQIERDYPELYTYLDENPITIPNIAHPVMDTQIFSEYLESLKTLLENHMANHLKNKE
jgi:hypothetical protein